MGNSGHQPCSRQSLSQGGLICTAAGAGHGFRDSPVALITVHVLSAGLGSLSLPKPSEDTGELHVHQQKRLQSQSCRPDVTCKPPAVFTPTSSPPLADSDKAFFFLSPSQIGPPEVTGREALGCWQTLHAPFVGAASVSASARGCDGQHTLAVKGLGSTGRWGDLSLPKEPSGSTSVCREVQILPETNQQIHLCPASQGAAPAQPQQCARAEMGNTCGCSSTHERKSLGFIALTAWHTHILLKASQGTQSQKRFRTGSAHRLHLL